MKTRKELLEDLINLNVDLKKVTNDLSNYSWDSDEILAIVSSKQVINILNLALCGKIGFNILEEWANSIESREDLNFESERVKEVIEEIANPLLHEELNSRSIERLKNRLK